MHKNNFNLDDYFGVLKNTIDHLNRDDIRKFADLLLETKEKNKKVIIFGNGGSAATASHFACDINKGVSYNRTNRFKVLSLTDNIPTILAYSNDISYDVIFIEQLKNLLEPEDIVIGISGSGNSINVIKAIEYASSQGNTTIGITGYDGGKLKEIADLSINANVNDMQISEDIHMILVHVLMRILCSRDE